MEKILKKKYLKKLEYGWGDGVCDVLQINGQNIPAIDLEREFQKNEKGRPYAHTYYRSRTGATGAGVLYYSPLIIINKTYPLYNTWGGVVSNFNCPETSSFEWGFNIPEENGLREYVCVFDGGVVKIHDPYEEGRETLEIFADGKSIGIYKGKSVPRWAARVLAYKIITPNPPKWDSETVCGRFAVLKSPLGYVKFHASSVYAEKVWEVPMLFGFGVEAETEDFIVFLRDEEVIVVEKATCYEWQCDLNLLREKGSEGIIADAVAIKKKQAIDAQTEKIMNFSAEECAEILNANPEPPTDYDNAFEKIPLRRRRY